MSLSVFAFGVNAEDAPEHVADAEPNVSISNHDRDLSGSIYAQVAELEFDPELFGAIFNLDQPFNKNLQCLYLKDHKQSFSALGSTIRILADHLHEEIKQLDQSESKLLLFQKKTDRSGGCALVGGAAAIIGFMVMVTGRGRGNEVSRLDKAAFFLFFGGILGIAGAHVNSFVHENRLNQALDAVKKAKSLVGSIQARITEISAFEQSIRKVGIDKFNCSDFPKK